MSALHTTIQRSLGICVLSCFVMLFTPLCAQDVQETSLNVPEEVVTDTVPVYGYIDYQTVFAQMPEYAEAQQQFSALKEKYEEEATRAEKEFQQKFADFLTGQKDFPETILLKRQAELQDLMEKSIAFRKESQRLLQQAEKDMQKPICERLDKAIQEVALQYNLQFVLNTADHACPFLNPAFGMDITAQVLGKLATKE